MQLWQIRKDRRNPVIKTRAALRKTFHRSPRDLTRNWMALTVRRPNRQSRDVYFMTDNSNKPDTGMMPSRGHEDSDKDCSEMLYRSEFHDNRGRRKPIVNDQVQDDDDYFPVPEVLDEP